MYAKHFFRSAPLSTSWMKSGVRSKKEINKSRCHIYIFYITFPLCRRCNAGQMYKAFLMFDICNNVYWHVFLFLNPSWSYRVGVGRGLGQIHAVKMFRLQFTLNSRRNEALAYVYKSRQLGRFFYVRLPQSLRQTIVVSDRFFYSIEKILWRHLRMKSEFACIISADADWSDLTDILKP